MTMTLNRFLLPMSLTSVIVAFLLAFLTPTLWPIFQANSILNGVILGVLLFGALYAFRQVFALKPELIWLEKCNQLNMEIPPKGIPSPKILSPLMVLLTKNSQLTPLSLRMILDGVDARLQESREISRYMVGLLVFLGLLGTFWGLSLTIKSVASVITNLPTGTGVVVNFLDQLKTGLQDPLMGMGVAFSSSLFGLASSLVLGFFELQANQARHYFFKEVEDSLTQKTNLSSTGTLSALGEGSIPAYIQALLEQTAENLDGLQRVAARSEQERQILNSNLSVLCDRFSELIDQRATEKNLLVKIAESVVEFQKQLTMFSSKIVENEFGMDATTKQHIRSLNEVSHQLLEATSVGQETLAREVRDEIRVLTKTLNHLANEQTSATA